LWNIPGSSEQSLPPTFDREGEIIDVLECRNVREQGVNGFDAVSDEADRKTVN
jgi:hypothetical protein